MDSHFTFTSLKFDQATCCCDRDLQLIGKAESKGHAQVSNKTTSVTTPEAIDNTMYASMINEGSHDCSD